MNEQLFQEPEMVGGQEEQQGDGETGTAQGNLDNVRLLSVPEVFSIVTRHFLPPLVGNSA
jgi:hypothetical protein